MKELTRRWVPRESGTAQGRSRSRHRPSSSSAWGRGDEHRRQLPEEDRDFSCASDPKTEVEGDGFVVRPPLSEPAAFYSVVAGDDVQKRRLNAAAVCAPAAVPPGHLLPRPPPALSREECLAEKPMGPV